jgi:hypothetical protein
VHNRTRPIEHVLHPTGTIPLATTTGGHRALTGRRVYVVHVQPGKLAVVPVAGDSVTAGVLHAFVGFTRARHHPFSFSTT